MGSVSSASLPVLGESDAVHGELVIETLIQSEHVSPPALVIADDGPDAVSEKVQLLEGTEYLFEFVLPAGTVTTDHPDLFFPDKKDGRRGRLRPRLHTGSVPLRVSLDGIELGRLAFEVRSKKLHYEHHYRWMLRDIAGDMAEVVMERFGASQQRFSLDDTRDPETLYQRFAFLQSLIAGQEFESALRHIFGRPHVAWEDVIEKRNPSRGVAPSSRFISQLAKPGPRVGWGEGSSQLSTLPRTVEIPRTEATVDNLPNRFVKFAITHWRDVIAGIGDALESKDRTAPIERGQREVAEVVHALDEILSEDLMREVGRLDRFPVGNQVLQKRIGYRTVFRAYIEFELASQLNWLGGSDVFRAGQRDVATLYEYWTFMQLAKVVSGLCDQPLDFESLLRPDQDQLSLTLQRGSNSVLKGRTTRRGREIDIALHFNRSFRSVSPESTSPGTWTKGMRPDCSLRLSPAGYGENDRDIWLHFDAKYRVDGAADLVGADEPKDGPSKKGSALPEDLLKMHAYRDAIRHSSGAYVMYPGTQDKQFSEYNEILPGLGAFPLSPSEAGDAAGTDALGVFIDEALTHIGSQATHYDRHRFWRHQIYTADKPDSDGPWASFLTKPARDTVVLVGYVKNDQHYEWIREQGLYNVRASGSRGRVGLTGTELAADLVVLYRSGGGQSELYQLNGQPEIWQRSRMQEEGYPKPSADVYICFPIIPVAIRDWPLFDDEVVARLREGIRPGVARGAPISCTWDQLMRATT